MIAQDRVDDVLRLVATRKYSYRTIAKMTGVNRMAVSAIAQGKRQEPSCCKKMDDQRSSDGSIKRCPECGVLVQMPCIACQTRHAKRKEARKKSDPFDNDFLAEIPKGFEFGLRLKAEHQQRYAEVRRRRRLQEQMSDPRDRREDVFPRKIYKMREEKNGTIHFS